MPPDPEIERQACLRENQARQDEYNRQVAARQQWEAEERARREELERPAREAREAQERAARHQQLAQQQARNQAVASICGTRPAAGISAIVEGNPFGIEGRCFQRGALEAAQVVRWLSANSALVEVGSLVSRGKFFMLESASPIDPDALGFGAAALFNPLAGEQYVLVGMRPVTFEQRGGGTLEVPRVRLQRLAPNQISDLRTPAAVPAVPPGAEVQASARPPEASNPAPAHDCDRLAQPPRATLARYPVFAAGVEYRSIDVDTARVACRSATENWPTEVRFLAFLGRVEDKAGNLTEALRLYRLAVVQGNADAQAHLGHMYSNGRGVPRDDSEAARLFRLAAQQENPIAQNNLGWMYREGRGVPRDDGEAIRLFRLAAEQGNMLAQMNLGLMHQEGRGVPRDDAEAARFFRLAAEQGNPIAQHNIGWMYESGTGVPRDRGEAIRWYRLAAAQQMERATESLRRLGVRP